MNNTKKLDIVEVDYGVIFDPNIFKFFTKLKPTDGWVEHKPDNKRAAFYLLKAYKKTNGVFDPFEKLDIIKWN